MSTLTPVRPEQRQAALAAGTALFAMAPAAFFSLGYVLERLVAEGNAGVAFANLVSSPLLFKAGILGWLFVLISDIVVSCALYMFLKPIHPLLSLLGTSLRLLYTAILAMAVANLLPASLLASDLPAISGLPIDQRQALAMLHLEAFDSIWSLGLILFGGHLLVVGCLAWRSDRIPRIVSFLLLLASLGYVIVHLGYTLFPGDGGMTALLEKLFMLPMTVGELGFGLWLLFRGGKAAIRT